MHCLTVIRFRDALDCHLQVQHCITSWWAEFVFLLFFFILVLCDMDPSHKYVLFFRQCRCMMHRKTLAISLTVTCGIFQSNHDCQYKPLHTCFAMDSDVDFTPSLKNKRYLPPSVALKPGLLSEYFASASCCPADFNETGLLGDTRPVNVNYASRSACFQQVWMLTASNLHWHWTVAISNADPLLSTCECVCLYK